MILSLHSSHRFTTDIGRFDPSPHQSNYTHHTMDMSKRLEEIETKLTIGVQLFWHELAHHTGI